MWSRHSLRTLPKNRSQIAWSTARTTPQWNGAAETFQVTHPFHPLFGQVFVLVTVHRNWGEERVYYHDA